MKISRLKLLIVCFLACLVMLVPEGSNSAVHARKARIIIVTGNSTAPYRELLEGFKAGIAKGGKEAEFYACSVEESQSGADQPGRAYREGADLLFAIGARALGALAGKFSNVPVVCGLVPCPEDMKEQENVTGVAMEFPFEIQFQKMRQLFPHCRNIGVIHSAANTKKIERAAKVAAGMGFSFYHREVSTPAEIPDALEFLANRIDVLWTVPDELTSTPQTAKHLLLYSFRNRIPMVGLSAFWTKAGALYSLEWDYNDLGVQCAEMALRVLAGAAPHSLAPACPGKVLYSLNMKTALHMKIAVPDDVVRNAAQVFEFEGVNR